MNRDQEINTANAANVANAASQGTAFGASLNTLGTRIQAQIEQINRLGPNGLNGPQTKVVLANLAALQSSLEVLRGCCTNPKAPLRDIPDIQALPSA
jgi:hypothetical protein